MILHDNLHYNISRIDGYNKQWNKIVSEREGGKTNAVEWSKVYRSIKDGEQVVYLVHMESSVNLSTLHSLQGRINQYLEPKRAITFKPRRGGGDAGLMYFDMFQNVSEGKTVLTYFAGCVLWVGAKTGVIKNIFLKKPHNIVFDEYIIDLASKETYANNEMNKIHDLVGTIQRYAKKTIKVYFTGNPYTKFTPFVYYFRVNTKKIKQGLINVGPNWLLDSYKLLPELKEKILQNNPLYQFSDQYKKFAYDGLYIHDLNRPILTNIPNIQALKTIYKIEDRYYAYYSILSDKYLYYITEVSEAYSKNSKNKPHYVFHPYDLIDGFMLIRTENKTYVLNNLNWALTFNKVAFSRIEVYNIFINIFKNYTKTI